MRQTPPKTATILAFQLPLPAPIMDTPFSYISSLFHLHHYYQRCIRSRNGRATVGAGARWVQSRTSSWCGLFTFSTLFKGCSASQQGKRRRMVGRETKLRERVERKKERG
ncbi:hypothetical protein AMTRI_Chr04g253240 [Amborella trichopoda]